MAVKIKLRKAAGASEPRCMSSQAGLLTVGHLSTSPIGNLDPVDEAAREKRLTRIS